MRATAGDREAAWVCNDGKFPGAVFVLHIAYIFRF